MAAVSACGDSKPKGKPQPLVLGALLSSSGRGAALGPQQINGARLAIAEVNRTGGIDGAPLKLSIRDDRTEPDTGVDEMRALIRDDKALAVLGPTLSLIAVKADPVANQLRTPVLAISNTATGIVGRCAYACSWIWRVSIGEARTVRDNVESYIDERHPKSVMLLRTDPDLLGEEENRIAAASFRANGVEVQDEVKMPADTVVVTAYVRRAILRRPDVLFVGSSFGGEIAEIIKVARREGFTGAILGGNLLNSRTTIALAAEDGAGVRSGAAWSASNGFPANTEFITAFRRTYGIEPDQFAAQAYAGVLVLAQGLRRAKLAGADVPVEVARERLQAALADVALTTPLGPFHFTADHDVEQIVWIQEMDGKGASHLVGFCNPRCGGESG